MKFRRISENIAYQNERVVLYDDTVERPDGTSGRYLRFSYHGNPLGAVVVPRLPDGRFLLIQIHRYAVDSDSLEFPRGGGHLGETVEQVASRELNGETGLAAKQCRLLGFLRPDTAIVMTEVGVVMAELDEAAEASFRPGVNEAISGGRFATLDEVWNLVANGSIRDGFTLGAMALLHASGLATQPRTFSSP